MNHRGHRDAGVIVAVLAHRPAGRRADRARVPGSRRSRRSNGGRTSKTSIGLNFERFGNVGEAGHAHVGAHLEPGRAADLGHRRLALHRVFVVFHRQLLDLVADPDRRWRSSSVRWGRSAARRSGPSRADIAFKRLGFDARVQARPP